MKQTHALALIFARTNYFHEGNKKFKFPPLKQEETKTFLFL